MPSTTMDDQINPQFKQTPDDESIATQEVRSGSDQSTSDSITLQTRLLPSEDTDHLLIEQASPISHSLSARFPSATERDEAMAMLKLLHSLIAAPSITHTVTDTTHPPTVLDRNLFKEHENFDVTERFSVSLFDEDDESLVKSLNRCNSVCNLVPPDQCIDDIPAFVDILVSSLDSESSSITINAADVLSKLLFHTLDINDFIQKHWKKLRTAFQDGSHGAHVALLHVILLYAFNRKGVQSAYPSLYQDFDLEGIVSADLSLSSFLLAIDALVYVKILLSQSYDRDYVDSLFLSFEEKQRATARIWQCIVDGKVSFNVEAMSSLIKFCLVLSLLFGQQLHPDLFDYILNFSNLHAVFDETKILQSLLNHSSTNLHPQSQQTILIQLLFEKTLRFNPSVFFDVDYSPNEDLLTDHLIAPFVGLHSLFVRGFHLQDMDVCEEDVMGSFIHFLDDSVFPVPHQYPPYALFPPPLVVQFFSNLIVQFYSDPLFQSSPATQSGFILSDFLFFFLGTCGPFGECRALLSLLKFLIDSISVGDLDRFKKEVSTLSNTIVGLHWFSLPLSFSSPFLLIPHILTHLPGIEPSIQPCCFCPLSKRNSGNAMQPLVIACFFHDVRHSRVSGQTFSKANFENCTSTSRKNRVSIRPFNNHIDWTNKARLAFHQIITGVGIGSCVVLGVLLTVTCLCCCCGCCVACGCGRRKSKEYKEIEVQPKDSFRPAPQYQGQYLPQTGYPQQWAQSPNLFVQPLAQPVQFQQYPLSQVNQVNAAQTISKD
ncbi:hypothetical protein BLNAU_14502 [Blattamonas nauphoetae]|uniref:Uncharacterized protein n=1 Tax=Blattamonas nauphoetae TaxID=2049346 RepID=A0ABQ9XFP9_9EUKA|nr:hypothetical protein BLNAU_14502 [Blattamonas nauphoetae]